jgi:hypothetical protein
MVRRGRRVYRLVQETASRAKEKCRKGRELRTYRFGRRHLADCFLSVEAADRFNAEPDPLGVRQADLEIGRVAPSVFDRPLADQFGLTFVADFGSR